MASDNFEVIYIRFLCSSNENKLIKALKIGLIGEFSLAN